MKKEEKKNKAQISIFIVITVFVITFITALLIFRGNLNILEENNPKGLSLEIGQINSIFEDCLTQRAVDAIRIVGLQGGYITLPEKYLATNLSNAAYGYYNGKKTLATKEIIGKEISSYIEASAFYCIDYENFPVNISVGKPSAKIKIEKDYVYVSVKISLSIIKEGKASTLNRDYNINIPIRLGDMHKVAEDIISREIIDPDYIQLSYLSDLDYDVMILPKDDNNIIYIITDDSNKTMIDNIPYSFLFANKIQDEI